LVSFPDWWSENEILSPADALYPSAGPRQSYPVYAFWLRPDFLSTHGGRYQVDTGLCDFYGKNITYNPHGWLRRTGVA
jgi:hypothetical protein